MTWWKISALTPYSLLPPYRSATRVFFFGSRFWLRLSIARINFFHGKFWDVIVLLIVFIVFIISMVAIVLKSSFSSFLSSFLLEYRSLYSFANVLATPFLVASMSPAPFLICVMRMFFNLVSIFAIEFMPFQLFKNVFFTRRRMSKESSEHVSTKKNKETRSTNLIHKAGLNACGRCVESQSKNKKNRIYARCPCGMRHPGNFLLMCQRVFLK